jgi:hypothetical protein
MGTTTFATMVFPTTVSILLALALVLLSICTYAAALNIVVPGGTGKVGRTLLPKLSNHQVTVLSRNKFLASAPGRVTEAFGYLGASFLVKNRHVKLRDWDGGDLLDIVGQDWVGWQDDALAPADVVIHLVGGFTQQRNMATERIVRESLRLNKKALQIVVLPRDDEIPALSPGLIALKTKRLKECENMVQENLANTVCLRVEANRVEDTCEAIKKAIDNWTK